MHNSILLVDHNSLLRQGLRSLLDAQGEFVVIAEAIDGRDAIRKAMLHAPELVLLDSHLPGSSGLETAVQLKRRVPGIRVVMLTETKTYDCVHDSLNAGADGFVLKCASFDELLVALRCVVLGKVFLSPDVAPMPGDRCLQPDLAAEMRNDGLCRLTQRERSILQLVAEGRTNRATAEFLSVSSKTVEKHRARLMRKLRLRNATELILAAMEFGLVERPALALYRKPPPVPFLPRIVAP